MSEASRADKIAREYVSEKCGRKYPIEWQGDDDSLVNFSPQNIEDAHLAGAKALLEWARSKQFDVINSESPVVGIWELEKYFAEEK